MNNWFVIMDGITASVCTQWARLFFVFWWIWGVCILVNLLVAYVLDAYQLLQENAEKTAVEEEGSNGADARRASWEYDR